MAHTGELEAPAALEPFVTYAFLGFRIYSSSVQPFLRLEPLPLTSHFLGREIGVITMSMMVRVSLGHTDRNADETLRLIASAILVLTARAFFRVFPSLISMRITALDHFLTGTVDRGIRNFSVDLLQDFDPLADQRPAGMMRDRM